MPRGSTDKLIAQKEAKASKVKKLKEEDEHDRRAAKGRTVGEEIEQTKEEIAPGRERYDNATRVVQEEIHGLERLENKLASLKVEEAEGTAKAEDAVDVADAEEVSRILME